MGHDTFLDIYQAYAEEITDASPDYHRFMGFSTMAAILKNRVWLPWGDTRLYPNLWIILLGASTVDHKSTAIMISKRLLDRYDSKLLYPNEFSYERLVMMLSKRPCGAFYFSEFKTLLGLLNRDYMQGARGLLADLYDAPYKYERELAKDTYTIDHPAFNVSAASTLAWFTDKLKDEDVEGGLLIRFLMILAVRRGPSKPRPPMADAEKRDEMYGWFKIFETISGPCYLTKAAELIHDEWYEKMRLRGQSGGGRFSAFAGRLQGYLVKFSILIEINQTQKLKISGESMTEAVAAADWLYKHMSQIEREEIVTGKPNKDIQKIRRAIRNNNGKITRRDLIRTTHLSKYELNSAIDTMEEQETIKVVPTRVEGSKKPVLYYSEVI